MNKIDKLIEEAGIQKLLSDIFNFKKKYFGFLDEKEYLQLLDLLHMVYYTNKDICDKKFNKYNKVIKRIKDKALVKLPGILYRGMSFPTEEARNSFTASLEKGKFPEHKKECSSWTTNKKMARGFLPGGFHNRSSNKYGVMLSLDPKDFKDDIVFTLNNAIFSNQEEKNKFLEAVFKSHQDRFMGKVKDNKKPHVSLILNSIGPLQGAVYATIQDEYILRNPNRNAQKIKIEKIDI
jgi:hypothetical protein